MTLDEFWASFEKTRGGIFVAVIIAVIIIL
jgi:hypothetical protein